MKAQIIEMLTEVTGLPASAIRPESGLVRDLGLDSLDSVDLMMKLEDTFHIQIPEAMYGDLKTVGNVIAVVEEKTGRLAAPAPEPVHS